MRCLRASRSRQSLVGLLGLLGLLLTPSVTNAQIAADTFIAGGLTFPIGFVQDPADAAVQFVVEQTGRIRVIQSGVLQATAFLDLSGSISCCGEQGLLGLAFPPDTSTSGRFFVNFTNPNGHTVIARFKRSPNPLVADPSSRFDLRWGSPSGLPYIEQPYSNHNGGSLVFGPDGYLYIGMGDGGAGNDPLRRAQDPAFLLGKMLRIDVSVADSHPQGYAVPGDNPFVGALPVATLPEIWAFGLRNPWKFSFDEGPGGTGALIIADVGQSSWEEVDYEPPNRGGRNYGWVLREGAHSTGIGSPAPGAPSTLIDPILEYDHSAGSSITGGFVYRGTALGASFNGRYFFADFSAGRVWSTAIAVNPITGEGTASNLVEHTAQLSGGGSVGYISSFGRDSQGELYLVLWTGSVLRLRSGTTAVVLTPDRSAPQPVGTAITWTATPSGGVMPYEFKWWVHDGMAWMMTTGWTTANTFTWTPSMSANYSMGVWVRSAGNPVDMPEASSAVAFAIGAASRVMAVALTPDRSAPQPAGTTITWTATPGGGVMPYEYKWWVYDGMSWMMTTGWTTANTFMWTPTMSASYSMGVWVRSAGNAADVAEASAAVPFAIAAAARVMGVALSPDRAAPQPAGTTITWTATPSGGVMPYQYKWWVYDGTAWMVTTGWTTANTFAWTPTMGANYAMGVWVRSAGNPADMAEASAAVPFAVGAASRVMGVALTPDRSAPQPVGTAITWTATPSGGVMPYQYKWWVYDGTAWMMTTGWTTANTFTWTPAMSANYAMGVWVRSAGNLADMAEASSAVPFAIP